MRYTIHSERPPEELLEDLRDRLDPERVAASAAASATGPGPPLIPDGLVNGAQFRVFVRKRGWQSRFEPECRGRVTASGGGSDVTLAIRPKARALVDFWMLPALLAAMVTFSVVERNWRLAFEVLLGVGVFTFLFATWELRRSALRKELLCRLFEDVTGRVRQEWSRSGRF